MTPDLTGQVKTTVLPPGAAIFPVSMPGYRLLLIPQMHMKHFPVGVTGIQRGVNLESLY